MLKQFTFSLLMCVFAMLTMSAAVVPPATPATTGDNPMAAIMADADFAADAAEGLDEFLNMTPKKYREMTGKKLSLKEVLVMKAAQKKIKKQMRQAKKQGKKEPPVSKSLFIVCAILLPIAAVIFMGLADDWEGKTWWVALILYALCYIPGLIYTLTKMKNYYD